MIYAILAAIAYRLGGMSGMNTKIRDFGVPLLFALAFGSFSWQLLLTCCLMFGALTTYLDSVFGSDNFFAHGLLIGLSTIPLYWVGVSWHSIAIYSISLSLIMGTLNYLVNKYSVPYSDWIEELSRGFIIIAGLRVLV